MEGIKRERTDKKTVLSAQPNKLQLALEPRILYDAAGLAAGLDIISDGDSDSVDHLQGINDSVDTVDSGDALDSISDFVPPAIAATDEIIFIDSNVRGYQEIIDNITQDARIIVLDPDQDGIEQITNALSGYQDLDAVHIISHGTDGQIIMSSGELSMDNITSYSAQLSQWAQSLSADADILLYGCDIAGNEQGVNLLSAISDLTGADVAASDDATGSADLSADWDLEVATGDIEAAPLAVEAYNDVLGVPSVSDLSDTSYTEGDSAVVIDSDVSLSGGISYSGGYIEFELTNGLAEDDLGLVYDDTISTVDGELSIVGGTVYLGDGSDAAVIGSVDATYDGQDGEKLRINFSNEFENGDFSDGTSGSTVITGWTAVNEQVKFGTDTIADLPTPTDTVWPTNNPSGVYTDQNTPTSLGTLQTVLSSTTNEGTGLSVQMSSSGMTTYTGYDIVRGPYIYSDGTVSLSAGDTVSFEWQAQGGGDAYDVYGYIVDVNTGHIETILNETGTSTSASTTWATETITVSTAGQYKFVFVSGTYDYSGGKAAGAQLYIDTVTVTQAVVPDTVNDSHLTEIAQRVTYENTSEDPDTTTRTLQITAMSETGDTGSASANITIAAVDDASVVTASGGTSTWTEDGAAIAIDSSLTVTDVDGGITGADVTIDNFIAGDTLSFADQNGITGSYDSSTGVLSLTGSASVANYQAALRSVTFSSTVDETDTTSRNVSFTIGSSSSSKTIAIQAVNDLPVLNDLNQINITDTSGADIFGDISDNAVASDVDAGTTLTYGISGGTISDGYSSLTGAYGILTIDTATGAYVFAPDNDIINALSSDTTDTFTVNVNDGEATVSKNLTVNIQAVAESTVSYTEQGDAVTPLSNASITTESSVSYSGGYIDFEVSDSESTETIGLITSDTASTEDGVVTIVGTTAYLGDGTTAKVIGSVDSTLNGENGRTLRINFSVDFENGDFEVGANGDLTVTGWTIENERVIFGQDQIAGQDTPIDATYPANNGSIHDSSGVSGSYDTMVISGAEANGGTGNSIRMHSSLQSSDGYAVIRGPYIYSNGTVALEAGDTVSFYWKAEGGSDAYDVYGYIINVDTGEVQVILDETGASTYATTDWAQESISVTSAGEYRFVFVSGSYDATGGLALGAQLYIDDVQVTQANPPDGVSGAALEQIARLVTYANSSDQSADNGTVSKTMTMTAVQPDSTSDSSAQVIGIIEQNDAPVLDTTTIYFTDTSSSDSFVPATGVLSASDVDTGSVLTYDISGGTDNGDGTVSISGDYGVLTINMTTGAYEYSPDDTAINRLGSDVTETFGISVSDGELTDSSSFIIDITGVNDTPLITTGSSASTVNEDSSLVFGTGGDNYISLSDIDAGENEQLVLTLSVNNGVITLGNTDGLTFINGADSSSSMEISGTLTDLASALEGLTYNPEMNFNGSDSISITLEDRFSTGTGGGRSSSRTVAITVNAADDAPVIASTGSDLAYTENNGPEIIDPTITISDVDDTNIESATVRISGNYVQGEDVLGFADTGTISGSFDAATGMLTLTGSDTTANYEAAIRSVTYENLSDDPDSSQRSITYSVNDGDLESGMFARNVNITPVNDIPVITSAGNVLEYTENDGALIIDSGITLGDTDDVNLESATVSITGNYVQGEDVLGFADTGTISGSFDAVTGILTLTGSGTTVNYEAALRSVTYENLSDDPDTSQRSIAYGVNDGELESGMVVNTVNITPVNDAPAVAQALGDITVNEDAASTVIDLSSVFSDVDDNEIAKTVLSNSNEGLVTAAINGDILTLDYQSEQIGTATIVIRGTSNGHTVDESFTVTVNSVNDNPTANSFSFEVDEDTPITIDGWQFSDPKELLADTPDYLTIQNIDNLNGSLKLGNDILKSGSTVAWQDRNDITFLGDFDYYGAASFTYSITDSADINPGLPGTSEIVTVTINVRPVEDPVQGEENDTASEDTEEPDNTQINDNATGTDLITQPESDAAEDSSSSGTDLITGTEADSGYEEDSGNESGFDELGTDSIDTAFEDAGSSDDSDSGFSSEDSSDSTDTDTDSGEPVFEAAESPADSGPETAQGGTTFQSDEGDTGTDTGDSPDFSDTTISESGDDADEQSEATDDGEQDASRVKSQSGFEAAESTGSQEDNDSSKFSESGTSSGSSLGMENAEESPIAVDAGISDMHVESGKTASMMIPDNAFSYEGDTTEVSYQATLTDGKQLPEWIEFDTNTGSFVINYSGQDLESVDISVTAIDRQGNSATTIFRIVIDEQEEIKALDHTDQDSENDNHEAVGETGLDRDLSSISGELGSSVLGMALAGSLALRKRVRGDKVPSKEINDFSGQIIKAAAEFGNECRRLIDRL